MGLDCIQTLLAARMQSPLRQHWSLLPQLGNGLSCWLFSLHERPDLHRDSYHVSSATAVAAATSAKLVHQRWVDESGIPSEMLSSTIVYSIAAIASRQAPHSPRTLYLTSNSRTCRKSAAACLSAPRGSPRPLQAVWPRPWHSERCLSTLASSPDESCWLEVQKERWSQVAITRIGMLSRDGLTTRHPTT